MALALAVSGCVKPANNASPQAIAAARYSDPGDQSLTLFTMISNSTGSGGHSSLLISGPERVIFDPAGSFKADIVPENDDVLFGISPGVEQAYRSAHARETHYVKRQKVRVTPEQAAVAYRLALQRGRVPDAYCASATSEILSQIPGFGPIKRTMSPLKLSEEFAALPGVVADDYYEGDSGDLQAGLAQQNVELNATVTE